jgi:hypothetical protein
MSRPLAVILILAGILLNVVGILVIVLAAQQMPRGGGMGPLFAGLAVEGVGVALLVAGMVGLRRARLAGMIPPGDTQEPTLFIPNKEVTLELDGSPYTVLYTPPVPGKHPRPSVLRISTPAPDARGEFFMAPQTWFDRVCKRFGLAVEIETGDEVFDAECYVRSDTPEFAAAYLGDSIKRVAILDLRRMGFPNVLLSNGVLTASWTGFNPQTHDKPELSLDTAARLLILSRNLPEHRPEFEHRTGSHRKKWQAALWLGLIGFALTILSLIAYPPVHTLDLISRALVVFVLALPAFAYVSAVLVRGTSTSHHAWGALMVGAIFLLPVGAVGSTAFLNGASDESLPVVHNAVITEKYTTRNKNRTNYHVRVASWRKAGETLSYGVSQTEFNAVTPHKSQMVVTTRAGAIGIEWLASRHIVAQPGK